MSHSSTPGPSPADAFETALAVMERRSGAERLTTGSGSLDALIGGLEPGGFYLFYGPGEDDALDRFIHRLVFEAVRPSPGREAIYVLCGNYRRSRTVLDLDYLVSLFVEAGMDVDDGLARIHMEDAVRFEDPAEFTGVVSGLRRLCYERGAALAATCRPVGRGPVPLPEGGVYLRHAASVIVYLRPLRDSRMSAHLVKHPESALIGRRVSYREEGFSWAG
jgi:hypothetical protein